MLFKACSAALLTDGFESRSATRRSVATASAAAAPHRPRASATERLTLHSSSARHSMKDGTTSAAATAPSFTSLPRLWAEAPLTSSSSSSKASFNCASPQDADAPRFPKASAAPHRTPPSSSVKSLSSSGAQVSVPTCPSALAAAQRTSSSSSSAHCSKAGTAAETPSVPRPKRPKPSAAFQRSRARLLCSFWTWVDASKIVGKEFALGCYRNLALHVESHGWSRTWDCLSEINVQWSKHIETNPHLSRPPNEHE